MRIQSGDINIEKIVLDLSSDTVIEPHIVISGLTGTESNIHLNIAGAELIQVVDDRDYY